MILIFTLDNNFTIKMSHLTNQNRIKRSIKKKKKTSTIIQHRTDIADHFFNSLHRQTTFPSQRNLILTTFNNNPTSNTSNNHAASNNNPSF